MASGSSIESMRGEVKHYLPFLQPLKAADELHYAHNKRLYSSGIKPEYGLDVGVVNAAQAASTKGGQTSNKKEQGKEKQSSPAAAKLKQTIEAAKQTVNQALHGNEGAFSSASTDPSALQSLQREVANLKAENKELRQEIALIRETLAKAQFAQFQLSTQQAPSGGGAPLVQKQVAEAKGEEEEDFDLFDSDDDEKESEEQKKIREQRLAEYAAKKSKKPGPIAKSSVILDVKPWDDSTNLEEMEKLVRSIEMDGLVWGAAKQLPVGYGIKKLQIICTIEDEKVSVDADLVERIQEDFEDHVQSVDIAAFNKI